MLESDPVPLALIQPNPSLGSDLMKSEKMLTCADEDIDQPPFLCAGSSWREVVEPYPRGLTMARYS